MDGRRFFDLVGAHRDLEWLGVREGTAPEVLVGHTPSGTTCALRISSVAQHPWKELEAVLTGRRRAGIMTHLTRIVGYYSRVENWNRSKLAELRDRHAGSYAVPETAVPASSPPREKELAAVA